MTLEQRIANLLQYSSSQVRNNKALFDEFVDLYTLGGGIKRDCMTCSFSGIFSKWKTNNNITKKPLKMANTYKLLNPSAYIIIPAPSKFAGEVITKNSPDEYVEEYLKQVKGDARKTREKHWFAELPVSMRPKPKKATPKKTVAKDGEKQSK